jgi:hypothetical protein
MRRHIDWLDRKLGRQVYRTVGTVAGLLAAICGYAAWWHLSRGMPYSWGPPLMFGIAAIVIASAAPYCFSRDRTFGEALDAMEGGAGDTSKWRDRRRQSGGRRG